MLYANSSTISVEIVAKQPSVWDCPDNMKTKALSYVRVSGKGQIDGDGFPRQQEAIARYAKINRIEIVQEFRDAGISGTREAFDRPGLTDCFMAIRANGVRLVLVETSSRVARDLMVGEIILAEFRKLGVKVVSADSGVDLTAGSNDPTSVLVRQILGSVSEFEKSVLVQKLAASRLRIRRSAGKCEGRKPYGVTESEQSVIAKMRAYRSEGFSFVDIADRLNVEGIKPRTPTRAGKETKWHPNMIQRIFKAA